MRLKIGHKVFLAMGLTTLIVLLASALLTRWSFQHGFLDYVNDLERERATVLATRLAEVYAEEGSWDFVEGSMRRLRSLLRTTRHAREPEHVGYESSPGMRPHHLHDPLRLGPAIRLLNARGEPLFGDQPLPPAAAERIAIEVEGEAVGYLAITPLHSLSEGLDVRFAERQTRSIFLISIGLLLLASVLAAWLARHLVAPVRSLAQGTRDLTAGRYQARIELAGGDELGELARDFNVLAATLESNRRSQREWLADISHELRTPLAVLRAEVQAVADGVRPFDRETLCSLESEVDRLSKLIDDLDELSRSDRGALSYHKQPVFLGELLAGLLESYRARLEQARLALDCELADDGIVVFGDPRRLEQLFGNLLENSIRYTESGGRVRVGFRADGERAIIEVDDSAPGVPDEALPRLFDRLYRIERSRSRASGGAGLGLAIARNIVTAHGGEIDARHSPLGGLRIRIVLPCVRQTS